VPACQRKQKIREEGNPSERREGETKKEQKKKRNTPARSQQWAKKGEKREAIGYRFLSWGELYKLCEKKMKQKSSPLKGQKGEGPSGEKGAFASK